MNSFLYYHFTSFYHFFKLTKCDYDGWMDFETHCQISFSKQRSPTFIGTRDRFFQGQVFPRTGSGGGQGVELRQGFPSRPVPNRPQTHYRPQGGGVGGCEAQAREAGKGFRQGPVPKRPQTQPRRWGPQF